MKCVKCGRYTEKAECLACRFDASKHKFPSVFSLSETDAAEIYTRILFSIAGETPQTSYIVPAHFGTPQNNIKAVAVNELPTTKTFPDIDSKPLEGKEASESRSTSERGIIAPDVKKMIELIAPHQAQDDDSASTNSPAFAHAKGTYHQIISELDGPHPNDLCPCGSGMKYKNCHGKGKFTTEQLVPTGSSSPNRQKTSKNRKIPSFLKVIIPTLLILAIGIGLWFFVISPQKVRTIPQDESTIVDYYCTDRATFLLKENGTVRVICESERSFNEDASGFEYNTSAWSDIIALCANKVCAVGLKSDGTVKADGLHSEEISKWKDIERVYCDRLTDVFGITKKHTIVTTASEADYDEDFTEWTDVKDVAETLYRGGCLFSLNADGTVSCATSVYPSMDGGDYDYDNVSGWENIVSIAATSYGIAGVKGDGTVLYEGWTSSDALLKNAYYDGVNTDDIAKLSGVKKVVAGRDHFSFLKNDGTVVSIGSNSYGQCATNQWENVVDITACPDTTIAKMSDGTLEYVGYNFEQVAEINGTINYDNLAVDFDSIKTDPYLGEYSSSDWKLNYASLLSGIPYRIISSDAVSAPFASTSKSGNIFEFERELLTNPVLADMVAQGISSLVLPDGETVSDANPWLKEFINKTTEAMSVDPDVHPQGIEIWLRTNNNSLYVNGDYRKYAIGLCLILNAMDSDIVEQYAGRTWVLPLEISMSSFVRTKPAYNVDMDSLVFTYEDNISFGIALGDKSLIIPN